MHLPDSDARLDLTLRPLADAALRNRRGEAGHASKLIKDLALRRSPRANASHKFRQSDQPETSDGAPNDAFSTAFANWKEGGKCKSRSFRFLEVYAAPASLDFGAGKETPYVERKEKK